MSIDLEKLNRAIELVAEIEMLTRTLADDNKHSIQLHLAKVHATQLEYCLTTLKVVD